MREKEGLQEQPFGNEAVEGRQRGTMDFLKPEKNIMVTMHPGAVYDVKGQVLARNAVDLVRAMITGRKRIRRHQ